MITKTEVNSKIDWHAGANSFLVPDLTTHTPIHNETETLLDARKHYFDMLRRFLNEVNAMAEKQASIKGDYKILNIFKKYNIHFVDVDDIKRVNIDEPEGE